MQHPIDLIGIQYLTIKVQQGAEMNGNTKVKRNLLTLLTCYTQNCSHMILMKYITLLKILSIRLHKL
jgi:hypothetical protein